MILITYANSILFHTHAQFFFHLLRHHLFFLFNLMLNNSNHDAQGKDFHKQNGNKTVSLFQYVRIKSK